MFRARCFLALISLTSSASPATLRGNSWRLWCAAWLWFWTHKLLSINSSSATITTSTPSGLLAARHWSCVSMCGSPHVALYLLVFVSPCLFALRLSFCRRPICLLLFVCFCLLLLTPFPPPPPPPHLSSVYFISLSASSSPHHTSQGKNHPGNSSPSAPLLLLLHHHPWQFLVFIRFF